PCFSDLHGVMSCIAFLCTFVAIATLPNGQAQESRFLADFGNFQIEDSPTNGVKSMVTTEWKTAQGNVHKVIKRQVYSAQDYGLRLPRPKPTPSPVQEKFFKEQIRSLPISSRDRLKHLYDRIGFTQEFQDTLMRELVRSQNAVAKPADATRQSVDTPNRAVTENAGPISNHRGGGLSLVSNSFPASGQQSSPRSYVTSGVHPGTGSRTRYNVHSGTTFDTSPESNTRTNNINDNIARNRNRASNPAQLHSGAGYNTYTSNILGSSVQPGQSRLQETSKTWTYQQERRGQQLQPTESHTFQTQRQPFTTNQYHPNQPINNNQYHQHQLINTNRYNSNHQSNKNNQNQHRQTAPQTQVNFSNRQSPQKFPSNQLNHNNDKMATNNPNPSEQVAFSQQQHYANNDQVHYTDHNQRHTVQNVQSQYQQIPLNHQVQRQPHGITQGNEHALNNRTGTASNRALNTDWPGLTYNNNEIRYFDSQAKSTGYNPDHNFKIGNSAPPQGYPSINGNDLTRKSYLPHPTNMIESTQNERIYPQQNGIQSARQNADGYMQPVMQPFNNAGSSSQPSSHLNSSSAVIKVIGSSDSPQANKTPSLPVQAIPTSHQATAAPPTPQLTVPTHPATRTISSTTVTTTTTSHPPPPQVVDFLNTKVIIPPHINNNPAMRAAFLKVIAKAVSANQEAMKHLQTSMKPLVVSTTPVTIKQDIVTTTSRTTVKATSTTTSAPIYNLHVEMAPALYLTWSLPQNQIDILKGSSLTTILQSINTSRSEQLPDNGFIEQFKTFLIDTLLGDPLSYIPSDDSLQNQKYYDRFDLGPTILVKDILGGFVKFDSSPRNSRIKRSLLSNFKKYITQGDRDLSKPTNKCSGNRTCQFTSIKNIKTIPKNLIFTRTKPALHKFNQTQKNSSNKIEPIFRQNSFLNLLKANLQSNRNFQITENQKPDKEKKVANAEPQVVHLNAQTICDHFKDVSQRSKCLINMRAHHIRRSHLQCRKVTTGEKKTKCKRNVVRNISQQSSVVRNISQQSSVVRNISQQSSVVRNISQQSSVVVQSEKITLTPNRLCADKCDKHKHVLVRRAAASGKSLPVLRFTWLLPKDSFPAAPLETMRYIMDKYKKKEALHPNKTANFPEATHSVLNASTSSSQHGSSVSDHMAYLNKLIEAANALSKLQGRSMDLLASAVNLSMFKSLQEGVVMKSHAHENHSNESHHMNLPLINTMLNPVLTKLASVSQVALPTNPTHKTATSTSTNNHFVSRNMSDNIGILKTTNTVPTPPQLQPTQGVTTSSHADIDNFMLAMSSKFPDVPPNVLRPMVSHLMQQFNSNNSAGSSHLQTTPASSFQPPSVNVTSPTVQLKSFPTDKTSSHHRKVSNTIVEEQVTQPPIPESNIPPPLPSQLPAQTSAPKTLSQQTHAQRLSQITTPPFRAATPPFTTTSVFTNRYLTMNMHFKGLPHLDVTTLPSINSSITLPSVIPTSASPAEVAEFMMYLMSTLRSSGQNKSFSFVSHHDSATDALTSGKENITDPQNTNVASSLTNPLHDISSVNKLNTELNSKILSQTDAGQSNVPSMSLESMLFKTQHLDNVKPRSPQMDVGQNRSTQGHAMEISSHSPQTNIKVNPQMVDYIGAALNQMLMSNSAFNVLNAHNHVSLPKGTDLLSQPATQHTHSESQPAVQLVNLPSQLSGPRSSSQLSEPQNPSQLSGPHNPSQLSEPHSPSQLSGPQNPSQLSTNLGTISSQPNGHLIDTTPQGKTDTSQQSVRTHVELSHQNILSEAGHLATSMCLQGQRMSCQPTRPSPRLVSFCQQRCDASTGLCSSALCQCSCLDPSLQTAVSSSFDKSSVPVTSNIGHADKTEVNTLQSGSFQISMVNPELQTSVATTTDSTMSEERLRKFLTLMEKVKGKKSSEPAKEEEPPDR
ncbi:mucin-6, partial [Biomphalaria glabrata]